MHGRQLPEGPRPVDAGVEFCGTSLDPLTGLQLRIEPSPLELVPPMEKKVWSKASDSPAFPSSTSLFPCQPTIPPTRQRSRTTQSRDSVPPYPTSSISRCRRPSLSSKRPLRACQLTPARLQSSSLNEIPNSVRPSTKFRRLSPSRARLRSGKRGTRSSGQGKPAFELKSTGYYHRPTSLALEAT